MSAPNHTEPTIAREPHIRAVDERLRAAYGVSRLGNKDDPLDELFFIILSGATTEATYSKTFDALRERFPTWNDVANARQEEIEVVLQPAGLSKKKASAIKAVLAALAANNGSLDLSFLNNQTDEDAYDFLRTLPGVGPKTARCVLAYSTLNREAFPVDAHVSRVVQRLGWSAHDRLTDRVHDAVQATIPPDVRQSLHVNLVIHGRTTCKQRRPRCRTCVLRDLCPSAVVPEKAS